MKRALTISTQKFQRKEQQEKKRTTRSEKRKPFLCLFYFFQVSTVSYHLRQLIPCFATFNGISCKFYTFFKVGGNFADYERGSSIENHNILFFSATLAINCLQSAHNRI